MISIVFRSACKTYVFRRVPVRSSRWHTDQTIRLARHNASQIASCALLEVTKTGHARELKNSKFAHADQIGVRMGIMFSKTTANDVTNQRLKPTSR